MAAEDFITGRTTSAITASVLFCLVVGFIAGRYAETGGAVPVAATRSGATLSVAVSSTVLNSLGVISWSGKGDSGKGSSDDNEELHSVKKNKK